MAAPDREWFLGPRVARRSCDERATHAPCPRLTAFSFVEVLFLAVIVGLSVVPLVALGRATHRTSYFTRHQHYALVKAQAFSAMFESLPWTFWVRYSQKRESDPGLIMGSLWDGYDVLFDVKHEEKAGEAAAALDPTTFHFEPHYTSLPGGLGVAVSVDVQWDDPTMRTTDKSRATNSIKLERLALSREEAFSHSVPLPPVK